MLGRECLEAMSDLGALLVQREGVVGGQHIDDRLVECGCVEVTTPVLAVDTVAGDAKRPGLEFADLSETGKTAEDGKPYFLRDVLDFMRNLFEHLARIGQQAGPIQCEQLLESRFIPDLTSENQSLLVNIVGREWHVCLISMLRFDRKKFNAWKFLQNSSDTQFQGAGTRCIAMTQGRNYFCEAELVRVKSS